MSNQLVKNYNYMGNFYNANKTFCNAMNGTFTEPQKSKYFFDEHLSDNNDIEKELFENLKKPMQKTFVSAPTGSGKTYTLVKDIFPRLQEESNGICINLLFVPNRSQAEQMAQEYDSIVSIVGDEKRYRAIDTEHSGDYAVVYDKAEDVKLSIEKMITSGMDVHVHMVIDECHTLTSARFREQALKNMFELEEFVTKEKGSVIYITATAEAMSWIRVNQYLFFDYCKPHQKFQQLNLFTENQLNRTFKDFLLDCVLPHKGILRLNNKRMQQQLVTTLSHARYQVYKVDGDDKAYDVDEDGHIIYQNEFLNTVINQSAIINSDLTLCTSILDAGQNITGICMDGTKVQDPNYCGYYCILTINDLDFNNILQFANRIRYDTQSFNIVYFNKDISDLLTGEPMRFLCAGLYVQIGLRLRRVHL